MLMKHVTLHRTGKAFRTNLHNIYVIFMGFNNTGSEVIILRVPAMVAQMCCFACRSGDGH